eukprot:CAMPEP_0169130634 /NCGR_PEP_ID=MMETSP1015-20121227/37805_1 /TAXON_ID=342587 /ORGANISM="Karlodinium micrum, Strain CCMP2283" /LENGTH=159 /DNA_ID=CAMNT_0009194815 /DNA_START=42 /DNA_END=521 /DNA_ORIENTATION=+
MAKSGLPPIQNCTQAEMLERLCPPSFDARVRVPLNAKVIASPEERWWRSDSPVRANEPADGVRTFYDPSNGQTRGVLGHGLRTGPSCYQSQYQTGTGTAAHFRNEDVPPTISGYSGHIAGKYAGNIVGGTYAKSNEDAKEHLKTTEQSALFGSTAVPTQ